MPAENVIQLRALLAEKFPGLRLRLDEPRVARRACLPSGLPQLDEVLGGGFFRGGLTEIIVPGANCGSTTLLGALLEQTARGNEIVALIDGQDSFNPAGLEERVLTRLLWTRCQTAAGAVKAADLILRDGNLPLVLLDLRANPESQLRKIPATTWYRFQRLVEGTGTACIVFTPRQLLACAQARGHLRPQFSLAAQECNRDDLQRELKMDVADVRR